MSSLLIDSQTPLIKLHVYSSVFSSHQTLPLIWVFVALSLIRDDASVSADGCTKDVGEFKVRTRQGKPHLKGADYVVGRFLQCLFIGLLNNVYPITSNNKLQHHLDFRREQIFVGDLDQIPQKS